MLARGRVYIHSAPTAVCPHLEWAIADVLNQRVTVTWTAQPAAPGQLRTELPITGTPGVGGRLAAALKKWGMVRFEIWEDATPGADGERICQIPGRGLSRTAMSASGDAVLTESQIEEIVARASSLPELTARLSAALGADADAELEPFRHAGETAAVTWLHRVG